MRVVLFFLGAFVFTQTFSARAAGGRGSYPISCAQMLLKLNLDFNSQSQSVSDAIFEKTILDVVKQAPGRLSVAALSELLAVEIYILNTSLDTPTGPGFPAGLTGSQVRELYWTGRDFGISFEISPRHEALLKNEFRKCATRIQRVTWDLLDRGVLIVDQNWRLRAV